MPYHLSSECLTDYFCRRIKPKIPGQTLNVVSARILKDGSLELTDPRNDRFILTTSFIAGQDNSNDRIEIKIESCKPGVGENDVISFLEKLVRNDRIFERGQPLYTCPRHADTLEREYPSERDRMVCSIIDKRAGRERVQKAIYDTMIRPFLYYVLKAGSFCSPNDSKQ